jgi:hypothetical protein
VVELVESGFFVANERAIVWFEPVLFWYDPHLIGESKAGCVCVRESSREGVSCISLIIYLRLIYISYYVFTSYLRLIYISVFASHLYLLLYIYGKEG